jgi:hypothetical protein
MLQGKPYDQGTKCIEHHKLRSLSFQNIVNHSALENHEKGRFYILIYCGVFASDLKASDVAVLHMEESRFLDFVHLFLKKTRFGN